jgi:hypothetical protein
VKMIPTLCVIQPDGSVIAADARTEIQVRRGKGGKRGIAVTHL